MQAEGEEGEKSLMAGLRKAWSWGLRILRDEVLANLTGDRTSLRKASLKLHFGTINKTDKCCSLELRVRRAVLARDWNKVLSPEALA